MGRPTDFLGRARTKDERVCCFSRRLSSADSITVDGHKQLYSPMGLGILLLKSPDLALCIQKTANYVIRKESADLGKFTLEGSRPGNVIYLHASLSLLGKDGFSVLITRSCTLVRQLANRLKSHPSRSFQILHEPQSNLLLYRYIPSGLRSKLDSLTASDIDRICGFVVAIQAEQAQGSHFVSKTRVVWSNEGRIDAFRVVIANPLTTWEDVEACIQGQIDIGHKIEAGERGPNWVGWPFDM